MNGDPELDSYRFLLWERRMKATVPRLKLLKFFKERRRISQECGIEELSGKLVLSISTLYRAAEDLVQAGFLDKEKSLGDGEMSGEGKRPKTRYFLA
jgi:DNA-binding MarR family transcriptional regulator